MTTVTFRVANPEHQDFLERKHKANKPFFIGKKPNRMKVVTKDLRWLGNDENEIEVVMQEAS